MKIKAVQIKIYNNMDHWLRKHNGIFFLLIDWKAFRIAFFLQMQIQHFLVKNCFEIRTRPPRTSRDGTIFEYQKNICDFSLEKCVQMHSINKMFTFMGWKLIHSRGPTSGKAWEGIWFLLVFDLTVLKKPHFSSQPNFTYLGPKITFVRISVL